MSPLEPLDPLLESPTAHPLMKQRAVAAELVSEIQQANSAVGGMLLANMEQVCDLLGVRYLVNQINDLISARSGVSLHRLLCDQYHTNGSVSFLYGRSE